MAKVSSLILSPELEEMFYKTLQPQDRYTYSRLSMKKTYPSRRAKKGLSQRTLLPQIAELWNNLTSGQKTAWNTAGFYTSLSGYKLFVQDTAYRMVHEMTGLATPNQNHQAKIGYVKIQSPATGIQLIQIHPANYWIHKKVKGTKSQYQPVNINEVLSIPLEIGISYKSNLVACGSAPYAKFYAQIMSSYQGVDRINICEININLQNGWNIETQAIYSLNGYFISYNMYIELYNLRGELFFDNVKSIHGETNYARDPRCNNIGTTFTKAFYQIPKHWAPIDLQEGAEYETIYPET